MGNFLRENLLFQNYGQYNGSYLPESGPDMTKTDPDPTQTNCILGLGQVYMKNYGKKVVAVSTVLI